MEDTFALHENQNAKHVASTNGANIIIKQLSEPTVNLFNQLTKSCSHSDKPNQVLRHNTD